MKRRTVLAFAFCATVSTHAAVFKLAENGRPLAPVIVASTAGEPTCNAAKQLATQLQRICDGVFTVQDGDGSKGIVLGAASDFPSFAKDKTLTSKDITDRENYLLRSENDRLLLIGNTPQAVEHA